MKRHRDHGSMLCTNFLTHFKKPAPTCGVALLCAATFLVAGCKSSTPSSFPDTGTTAGATAGAPTDPTLLSSGDVIRLEFSGAPELSQSQRIRADGKLTLPLIGEVAAAGESFPTLQKDLEGKYKTQLKNSDVVITLESSSTRSVTVDGFVRSPSSVPCDRPLTAFEVIMMAGGYTDDADMKRVQIIRLVNGKDLSIFVDLRGAMHGQPVTSVTVRPGDIVFVPEKAF
jgi:protein involved in polysaccharide export with SLBB domain